MKSHYKRALIFLGSLLFVITLIKGHYFFTKGFRVDKILHPIDFNEKFYLSDEKLSDDIESILNQEFTYLGKGRQAYVFESFDQKYVIKFFRLHKYHFPIWAKLFSSAKLLTPYQNQILSEKKEREVRASQSYQIAYDQLKDQTKLIYMHSAFSSHLRRSVQVKDFIGRKFSIPLNHVSFCIQKKATSIKQVLEGLIEEKDDHKIKQMIVLLLENVQDRISKNILNRDYSNFLTNYGWDGQNVIEIDIGSFYLSSGANKEELMHFTDSLECFLEKKAPHLHPFYLSQIDHLTKDATL